jgi:hypothetical protein
MGTDTDHCVIKAKLLYGLSTASVANAQQTALLSARAVSSDHDGFSELMKHCEEAQASYSRAWDALASHLLKHGC